LEIIFEQSLKDKEVRKSWKEAQISVIFKKGKKCLAGNYRPVSLTSVVCKAMETMVREQVIRHEKQQVLYRQAIWRHIWEINIFTMLLL